MSDHERSVLQPVIALYQAPTTHLREPSQKSPLSNESSSATQVSSVSGGVSPLMRIPRELRDKILEYALDDRPITLRPRPTAQAPVASMAQTDPASSAPVHAHGDETPIGIVLQAPSTNVLQLCKQIQSEYLARAEANMTLVLKDRDIYTFQLFHLPRELLYNIGKVEVHLLLFCHCWAFHHCGPRTCKAERELKSHLRWMSSLLASMPRLHSLVVHLNIAFCHYCFIPGQSLMVPCEPFITARLPLLCNLARLKELTVARYDHNHYPGLDGPRDVFFTWPPATQIGTEGQ